MGKNGNMKAFTIIELMVSIFLTLIVVASFYKLYNMASREERSSAIRISLNVAGEQMLDAISNAIRFIGLNGKLSDLDFYNSGSISSARPLIKVAQQDQFEFLSPYGGPVTKLAKNAEGTYPNCTFTLVSSAAITNKTKSFFIHNQDGIFETAKDEDLIVNISSDGLTFKTDSGFQSEPKTNLDGTECGALFPAGTLVSGQDNFFMLKYDDANRKLQLCFTDKETMMDTADCITNFNSETDTWLVNFTPSEDDGKKSYDMPTFVIQYLTETASGNDLVVKWQNYTLGTVEGEDLRKDIIAVRFGFVLTSERTRNLGGYPEKFEEKYCIFGDPRIETKDCYTLTDPNKTAYVFRRVVYLANHRLLKDFNN